MPTLALARGVNKADDDFDEDEEIPDESPNAAELIKVHDRLISRGSITNNILSHSFVIDTPLSMLSSINDSLRDSVPFFHRESPIKNSTMSLKNNEIY